MGPEKIAQSHKRPDSLDVSWRLGILDCFEHVCPALFVFSWFVFLNLLEEFFLRVILDFAV
jgi:hypothetical protein